MSSAPRRLLPRPRSFGVRTILPPRPYYGKKRAFGSVGSAGSAGSVGSVGAGASVLGGALGALGGTLGCLLCLSAIAALGLFSCVVALTAYAKQFLDAYKTVEGISGGAEQLHIGFILLFTSLFYIIVCRMQRN
ncbi:unnamed protein product [Rotaria sp. Silwood2]|nr:unnamed protein product [Rotaria sp. Silwood2]CAF4299831.1 unnamed protein product [Rotaria sp. Silwood2]